MFYFFEPVKKSCNAITIGIKPTYLNHPSIKLNTNVPPINNKKP